MGPAGERSLDYTGCDEVYDNIRFFISYMHSAALILDALCGHPAVDACAEVRALPACIDKILIAYKTIAGAWADAACTIIVRIAANIIRNII